MKNRYLHSESPNQFQKTYFHIHMALGVLIFLFLSFTVAPSYAKDSVLKQLEREFKEIVTTVRPDVVKVLATAHTTTPYPENMGKMEMTHQHISSGIILDNKGHIVTTTFDMAPNKIEVIINNNKKLPAEIVGVDKLTDLVVLKIQNKLPRRVKSGDSSTIDTGSWVFTVGSTQGNHPVVSFGIVSGREILPEHPCDELLKINAPVSPGNSGGAIVNTSGEIVGMILAVLTQPNEQFSISPQFQIPIWNTHKITFAIPIETVEKVAKDIIKYGKVPRGWLGVEIETSNFGVHVTNVIENSPAHKNGILPRDIILEFNKRPVKNYVDLLRCVGRSSPNTEVIIKIHRNGSEQNHTIKLGER